VSFSFFSFFWSLNTTPTVPRYKRAKRRQHDCERAEPNFNHLPSPPPTSSLLSSTDFEQTFIPCSSANGTCPPCVGPDNCVTTTSGEGYAVPLSASVVTPDIQVATQQDTPAPTITQSTAYLALNAPTLVISGVGFNPAGGNTVTFDNATGEISAATATQLTVSLTTAPTLTGPLTAVVQSFDGTSSNMQVATLVAAPTVTLATANLAISAGTLIIRGINFDPTASGNTVQLSSGDANVASATATQLTLLFTSASSLGNLTAVVTSFGGSSGNPVQVATVIAAPTVVPSTAVLATSATTLFVAGSGFDPEMTTASVQLSTGNATITSVTATQLTLLLTAAPSPGPLTAIASSYGGASGQPVQVANIVQAPSITLATANLATSATSLFIAGANFDSTAGGTTVLLNTGNATITSVTETQLTLQLTSPPSVGNLTAVVSSYAGSSGAVQVATATAVTVFPDVTNLASTASALVINGTGFDAAGVQVTLSSGGATVSSITPTQITMQFTSVPSPGVLTAVVASYGGTSGSPVQVANVVAVSVAENAATLAQNAPTLVIGGAGFDPLGCTVALSSGDAIITAATSTQLTVQLTATPSTGEWG